MNLCRGLFCQIRLLDGGLGEKQENTAVLFFGGTCKDFIQAAEVFVVFSEQKVAQPGHAFLRCTRNRFDFPPFLINQFGLFKCIE